MNNHFVKLLDAIAGLKVMVIGEAMLDCYLSGVAERLCPEAPVPVVTVNDLSRAPGGAANTAVNVHTLGGRVTFLSVIGDDWEGTLLRQALEEHGVSTKHVLTQPARQTLAKQRVMAVSQLLVRFDQGSTDAIAGEIEQELIDKIASFFADCDAVIVSDYGYGILTTRVIQSIAKLQHAFARVLVVDSKNLTAYRHVGITAVKPNYNQTVQLLGIETLHATSVTDCDARANQIATHSQRLLDLTSAQIAAVSLDAEGAIIFERDRPPHRTLSHRASQSCVTGAGDTFVSALTLALAAKATTPVAADLAASAAAVVVGKDGTTACSAQELRGLSQEVKIQESAGELGSWGTGGKSTAILSTAPLLLCPPADNYLPDPNRLITLVESYRASGRRIVFTNGCFDILHSGHVSYLKRARELGDILIIGVNSDVSVSRLKGPSRPINPLEDRIQVLGALGCVDHLVPFDDDTPINLIRMVRPDVYVKGGDYTKETLPEAPLVEQMGGVVEILPFVENRSTSSMIERICQTRGERRGASPSKSRLSPLARKVDHDSR